MGGVGRVEVIGSKGCSKLFVDISSSFRGLQPHSLDPPLPMSPASSNTVVTESRVAARSVGPLSGLVICVTGLSKEARIQVMEATERLGGQYSPHLHPQCTHLVVQSFCGRKFEHALKHGSKVGLLIVTLGWFVDSVRNNVRLSESLYSVKVAGEGVSLDVFNRIGQKDDTQTSCLPKGALEHHKKSNMIEEPQQNVSEREYMRRTTGSPLSGHSFYVDVGVSDELRRKVVEAASAHGATLVDQWFVGCGASHIVCEGNSIRKYLGHSTNIVTPLWVLKTVKEKQLQRLVHISADLAKQTGIMIDSIQSGIYREDDAPNSMSRISHEERQKIVNLAKDGVRKRRGKRMQTCQTPMRPITPSSLLDSICWSISEPTSTASIYMDSSSVEDANLQNTSVFYDAKEDGKESEFSFVNLSRPLKERSHAARSKKKVVASLKICVPHPPEDERLMGLSTLATHTDGHRMWSRE